MTSVHRYIYLFMVVFVCPQFVLAYPQYIGHGYTSCMNCHFNPFGGGQINDYGRVVAATAISSKELFPRTWTEEKFADFSGFLFRQPTQSWLRTQINYRGFGILHNPRSAQEKTQWMNMQLDIRATLKFGENDKFILSGDYGKTPYPQSGLSGKDYGTERSRSHYIGYKINENYGVYAGMMDKVYGLRVIEHTAYSRMTPQVTQNDQTHGIAGHYLDDLWEGGVHLFTGNMSQDSDLRMKGISSMVERTVADVHRLGGSVQIAKNDYQDLTSLAGHSRFNLNDGSALLTEVGIVDKKTKSGLDTKTSHYGLLQTYLRPTRGVYVLSNIEYFKNDSSSQDYVIRWGPGVQYFLAPKVEMRADLFNTRSFGGDNSSKDLWLFLYQIHVWL